MHERAGGGREPSWILAVVVVGGVAIAVVAAGGGSGAQIASARPGCGSRSLRSSTCPHSASFSVARYLGHGDGYDCDELASQADAQAVLRADPTDPNHLDAGPGDPTADRDGIA